MNWKNFKEWVHFLTRFPFMEAYCRIRYKCSWQVKLDRDIEELFVRMHVVLKELEEE